MPNSVAWLISLVLFVFSASARADDPNAFMDSYQAADALFRESRYDEALAPTEAAIAAYAKARGTRDANYARLLNLRAQIHDNMARLPKAERDYEDALDILEVLSPPDALGHTNVLINLGMLHTKQKDLVRGEARLKRALDILRALPEPPLEEIARALDALAEHYAEWSERASEAEQLYYEALAMRRAIDPEGWDVAASLNNIASFYKKRERGEDARRLFGQSMELLKKLNPLDPHIATVMDSLAELDKQDGLFERAEAGYRAALKMRESLLPPRHPAIIDSWNNIAELLRARADYWKAEDFYFKVLLAYDAAPGPDSPDMAIALNNYAGLLMSMSRYEEAEANFRRSIRIRERLPSPPREDLAISYLNYGSVLLRQGKLDRADEPLRKALDLCLGKPPLRVGLTMSVRNSLAQLARERKDYASAEGELRQIHQTFKAVLGERNPATIEALANVANVLFEQRRRDEARPLMETVLIARTAIYGEAHPKRAGSLNDLGWLSFDQGDYAKSLDRFAAAAGIYEARRARMADETRAPELGQQDAEINEERHTFIGLARAALRVSAVTPADAARHVAEAFVATQRANQSEAGSALTLATARLAAGSGALAETLRRRQDLLSRYRAIEKALTLSLGGPPDAADAARQEQRKAVLAELNAGLEDIDRSLKQNAELKRYFWLIARTTLSIAETRTLLEQDEVLLMYLVDSDESLVWAIAQSAADDVVARINVGRDELATQIGLLRCGLDVEAWKSSFRCRDAFGSLSGTKLPFSLKTAFELYEILLGPVKKVIKNKSLLIVPTGPLASLPFAALVTERPAMDLSKEPDVLRRTAWLGPRQALIILPSVASLAGLRTERARKPALEPLLAFAHPELDGLPTCRRPRPPSKIGCGAPEKALIPAELPIDPVLRKELGQPFDFGTLGDPDELRTFCPLPESEDEAFCVGRQLGAPPNRVFAGPRATETQIKSLALDRYRTLLFSTHGLTAEQTANHTRGLREPALLLTPGPKPTLLDDGLLTASEVSELKLNADWVVLSACNTAAGRSASSAESLSGLARAFFFAGARAVMVSHWSVHSEATARLMVKTFAGFAGNRRIGRAEALRKAMQDMLEPGGSPQPEDWASFMVVGEGTLE